MTSWLTCVGLCSEILSSTEPCEEHGCTDHNGLPEACYPQEHKLGSGIKQPLPSLTHTQLIPTASLDHFKQAPNQPQDQHLAKGHDGHQRLISKGFTGVSKHVQGFVVGNPLAFRHLRSDIKLSCAFWQI